VIYMLPMTPATIAYAVALAAVIALAVWRDRRLWPVAAVMVANWLATRAVTAYELPGMVQAVADLTSAAVLLALRRFSTIAVLPVSALFAIMVFFYGVHDAGLITRDTMWAWADVLAYGQLLIIAGGAVAGGGRGRLALASHRRGRVRAMAFAVAKRLQAPPPP
jgi:membrane protease YdiL (CAAX protease family)